MGDEEQLLLEELQDSLEDIGYTKVDRNQHSVRLFMKKHLKAFGNQYNLKANVPSLPVAMISLQYSNNKIYIENLFLF